MEHKSDFDLDLKLAQIVEAEIRQLLQGKNHIGEKVTFEVKNDWLTDKTGNLFFEFESRGKPSGLATTKADWFWYTFQEHAQMFHFVFQMRYLKMLLKKRLDDGVAVIKPGGDEYSSKGVLISIANLIKEGKK